jgi:hypothetical protein
VNLRSAQDEQRTSEMLSLWTSQRAVAAEDVCWVKVPVDDSPDQETFVEQQVATEARVGQP